MKTKISRPDIVKKMREIRDQFSLEIMEMTFEEEQEFIRKQLDELKLKKKGEAIRGLNLEAIL